MPLIQNIKNVLLGSIDKIFRPIPISLEIEPKSLAFNVKIDRHICRYFERRLLTFAGAENFFERGVVEKNRACVLCQVHFYYVLRAST